MKTTQTTDQLKDALDSILSGDWTTFEHLMVEPSAPALLDGTSTTVRCHYLASDPSGNPQTKLLARRLASQIYRFCTPQSRINAIRLLDDDARDEAMTDAVLEARQLFTTTQEHTGEGGELLLYALLERHLRVPQILSKMSLKTNTQMQIHGSDGIHAKIEADGVLALYWGESKIVKKQSDAFTEAFKSTAPFLTNQSTAQDILLIQTYADIGDLSLRSALLDYFDPKNSASAKCDTRAACLIGFPVDEYPSFPNSPDAQTKITAQILKWHDSVLKRVADFSLQKYKVEVFLVPLPSEVEFREEIKAALNA